MTPIAELISGNLKVLNANPYYVWTPITNGFNVQNKNYSDTFNITTLLQVLADGILHFDDTVGNTNVFNVGIYQYDPAAGQLLLINRNANDVINDAAYVIEQPPELQLYNTAPNSETAGI